jgi:hypothetical protein
MWESERPAKFLFEYASRTDTLPFAMAIGILVAIIYLSREYRLRELETLGKERRDQAFVFWVLLIGALFVVPATTIFRPDNPVDVTTTKDMFGSIEVQEYISVDNIDVLMGMTVVAIIMVMTVMVWPMTCDTCDPPVETTVEMPLSTVTERRDDKYDKVVTVTTATRTSLEGHGYSALEYDTTASISAQEKETKSQSRYEEYMHQGPRITIEDSDEEEEKSQWFSLNPDEPPVPRTDKSNLHREGLL